jgi:hypothetical protein
MDDPALQARYDRNADVLYLSLGTPDRRARTSETPEGVIRRTLPSGDCQGVTVRNFHIWWYERRAELVGIVSDALSIPKDEIDHRIPELVA